MSNRTVNVTQPQRQSGASIALITRTRNGQTEWLLQWNPKWHAMNFIGGTREATDANDLTCLIREIHEELFEELSTEELTPMQTALSRDNDTYIRRNSVWQDAYIDTIMRIGGTPFECNAVSGSAKCLTHYTFHIYKVNLQTNIPFFQYDSFDSSSQQSSVKNEWGTAEDIRRGVTAQGRPIGHTVTQILTWIQTQDGLLL